MVGHSSQFSRPARSVFAYATSEDPVTFVRLSIMDPGTLDSLMEGRWDNTCFPTSSLAPPSATFPHCLSSGRGYARNCQQELRLADFNVSARLCASHLPRHSLGCSTRPLRPPQTFVVQHAPRHNAWQGYWASTRVCVCGVRVSVCVCACGLLECSCELPEMSES